MRRSVFGSAVLIFVGFVLIASSFTHAAVQGSDSKEIRQAQGKASPNSFHPVPYSPQRDMAVISVMGSRPKGTLKGFKRAVLYDARGALVKEVDVSRSDSIYVLDKVLQENRKHGPLFIKMIK